MTGNPISLAEPPRPQPRWELDLRSPAAPPPLVLDPSQQRVVAHRAGALLVLAGPGTGKTATLTAAVAARLRGEAALTADQVLVLTFARKAAGEIRDRVLAELGGGAVPAVLTFHSLALALVREFGGGGPELRLLSAAEQEYAVREVLQTLAADERVAARTGWPVELGAAIGTRGMGVEIRNALARARSLGLEPAELRNLAIAAAKPEWVAAAALLEDYLDAVEQQVAIDYNELILQAQGLAARPEVQQVLHRRYAAVFVDEYQDTDPLQVELLRAMVAPTASLIAVGDPDQSIYSFRGASSRAIKDFASDFAHLRPGPAEIAALQITRRFGDVLRAAAARVISRNGLEDLPIEVARAHRELTCAAPNEGELVVRHYESAEVEAEEVAEAIRALVLANPAAGYEWSDVAVLVRAGAGSIPGLERALIAAGVPVRVTFDDLPLAAEPAVATLLSALAAVGRPEILRSPELARALLTSPLAQLDAVALRRLGRGLRSAERAAGQVPRWSEQLIADALADPGLNFDLSGAQGAAEFGQLAEFRARLFAARERLLGGATVAEVLWDLWDGSAWPRTLRRRALSGQAGAAQANHDLDAVTALFHLAEAAAPKTTVAALIAKVRAVQVPLQERANAPEQNAVTVLTAHRAKGLEWRAVFVCSADEAKWPDIRRRSSIFEPDRLRRDEIGSVPERHELVAEERRLFYVACTRATEFLHVSTTAANPESGRSPSRFIAQLLPAAAATADLVGAVAPPAEPAGAMRFSPTALVAQLRRVAVDPAVGAELRQAAAARLARLAGLRDSEGRLLVPGAHPDAWWATAPLTVSERPIDAPDQPLYIRGSALETLNNCSLSWFMTQRAGASAPGGVATNFGSVVHALAAGIENGEVRPEIEDVERHLDQVWDRLRIAAPWSRQTERTKALKCISTFLQWRQERLRADVRTEAVFEGVWQVNGADGYRDQLKLRGSVDILEISDAGGVCIVDLKTSSTPVNTSDAEVHPQLGIYQVAALQGLLTGQAPGQTQLEGAELVYLRLPRTNGQPTRRVQPPLPSTPPAGGYWIEHTAAAAAKRVRSEDFQPNLSKACDFCPIRSSCPAQPTGRPVLP